MKAQSWFAACPKGIESLLVQEVAQLGAEQVRETVAGCSFEGPWAVAYRVALWSRLANRVLAVIAEVEVDTEGRPLPGMAALPWEDWLPDAADFMVAFAGRSPAIRNTHYGAQLVKDAIVDRFRSLSRPRPSVARNSPAIRFQARLRSRRLSLSLDFVGASLHQRGYRLEAGMAPLKENLAAAMLLRADWPGIAARGGALIDPFCGSGTLLIEAAMMAADIAPGLGRDRWAFEQLAQHNPDQWRAILADAQGRATRGRELSLPEIRGYDASPRAVEMAQANIARVGLQRAVRVSCKPLHALRRPTHTDIQPGLVISNPPYGERLEDVDRLRATYREWGERMLAEFCGWSGALLTPEKELGMATRLRSKRRYKLFNGQIPCSLLLFDIDAEQRLPQQGGTAPEVPAVDSPGAQMFANRLRKNLRQIRRWSQREGHSCYRVYDADMPEYAFAVDWYEGALHVAEYRAPASVAEDAAQRRREEAEAALCQVFEVEAAEIAWKLRQRQRGAEQYDRQNQRHDFQQVREGQVKLWVNLRDYLDTGLFLDHRPLRLRLAAEARGKDFLNLFCYTATASVHAAAGGACSTTSVDLSKSYLEWGQRNLAANGFQGKRHVLTRSDCLSWLKDTEQDFDLILVDPPSFSNSKALAEDFDVQRDHAALLALCLRRLRPGGTLYFSNNLRSFRLDSELSSMSRVADITRDTIDVDFKRNPRIHQCWQLQHLDEAQNNAK
ncbi:MAG: bifunctional 23S rRNA (guanine(2069)-N(7))-methyltransferase RlmK/23S rRNA (guanine(2445)-N(2))-methyltransferase RlmL [Pseudomonadota bacterium]